MEIDIAQAVRSEGELFTAEFNGAFAGVDFLGARYEFPEGVKVRVDYRYDGEGCIVSGRFDAETTVACARCLKTFLYPVGFDFAEYYKKQPDEGEYAYQDDIIKLDQMLEDNVVLNLPTRFLCREDCKGLCSRCGKDLNEGPCGCQPEPDAAHPFSGLSRLYDDEEV